MAQYGPYNGDFLNDYSGIAAAGEGFKGFVQGMENAQDRQMKKTEFDAKMKAMQTQAERESLNQQIEMRKAHVMKDATGSLTDAPLSGAQQSEERLGEFKAGAKATGTDPNGYATGFEYDPSTLAAKKAEAMAGARAASNGFRQESIDTRKDAMDRREHERILTRINANPVVKGRLQQYQNLDNALTNIISADKLTPQQIMEFQQAVRSNMGLKGSSGVGERDETYFKSMGLNAANWMQFLSGDPAQLAKDSKMMEHFRQLATLEQKNIGGQFDKALKAASAGHSSMYARRDDLKEDLKDALQAQKEQMVSQNPSEPAQGLVKPEEPGLLQKLGGLVFGNKATADKVQPAPHPQDGQAIAAAKAALNDPKSSPELKSKAQAVLRANGL